MEETSCDGGGGGGGVVEGDQAKNGLPEGLRPAAAAAAADCSDARPRGNPENFDSVQMEELIDMMLEKYRDSQETTEKQQTTTDEQEVSSGGKKDASNSVEEEEEEEEETALDRLRRRRREEESCSIGGVVRSQKGVTETLMGVSEGLDAVNEDLEAMKKELERVQLNAYAVQLSCLFGGETMRDVLAPAPAPAAAAAAAAGTSSSSSSSSSSSAAAAAAEYQRNNRRTPKKQQQQDSDRRSQDRLYDSARHADKHTDLLYTDRYTNLYNDRYADKYTDRHQQTGRGSVLEEVRPRDTKSRQWNREWNSWTDEENLGQTDSHRSSSSQWRETLEETKPRQTDRQTDRQTVYSDWNVWANETNPRFAERTGTKINEWTEERQGILRLGQNGEGVLRMETERRGRRALSSDIPSSGRENEMTQLLARTEDLWKKKKSGWEEEKEKKSTLSSHQTPMDGYRHMRGGSSSCDGGRHLPSLPPSFYTDCFSSFSFIGRRRSLNAGEDSSDIIRRNYNEQNLVSGCDRTNARIIQMPSTVASSLYSSPSIAQSWRSPAQHQQQQQQHLSSFTSAVVSRQPLIIRRDPVELTSSSRFLTEIRRRRRNSVEGV